jgi:hypothetical protein
LAGVLLALVRSVRLGVAGGLEVRVAPLLGVLLALVRLGAAGWMWRVG